MIKDINRDFYSLRLDYDIMKIHRTSIKILEEIGIKIKSQNALELFDDSGCEVDYDSQSVKIPESVIDKILSNIYPLKKLYDRSGKKSIDTYGDNAVFNAGPGNIKIRELDGTFRNANFNDLINMTKIHDSLENIDIYTNAVDPHDISLKAYRTQINAAVIKNTSKPCYFVVDSVSAVEDIYSMCTTIRGSEESLREKPYFCIIVPSEAILGYAKKDIDILIKCAELGIPTAGAGYPIMGLTAPLSCSAAVALANANWLAAEVVKHSVDPMNPSQYNCMVAVVNMKNLFTITQSPEVWLSTLMSIKLCQHYKVPIDTSISSDSKDSDLQMAYEKALSILLSISAGANILSGVTNYLDSLNMASFEQVIIDDEIVSSISHYFNMLKDNPGTDDFELISNSLNNKTYFLDSESTLRNYKKFIWESDLFVRDNFLNWKEAGMPRVVDNANKRVKKILKEHEAEQLSGDIIKKIDRIVKDAMERENQEK